MLIPSPSPPTATKAIPAPPIPRSRLSPSGCLKKRGGSFEEFQRRKHLAYAALEEFFTDVLGGDVEEMGGVYDSYIKANNLLELYDKLGGDGGMDDFTGFDEFMLFHKPGCWTLEEE